MLKKILVLTIAFIGLIAGTAGCGGGGSSNSGLVLEGQLTQGATEDHSKSFSYRHAENEPISEVTVCLLNQCSITDEEGQFGMALPEGFKSGDVLVTAEGHGITAQTMVALPAAENELFLHLQHESGQIKVHHLLVDGERVEPEAHQHQPGEPEHQH
jgi:hypothetical protein